MATIGTVTYPTPDTWEVVVSDLTAGVNVLSLSSSTGETSTLSVGGFDGDPAPFAASFGLAQNATYQVANLAPATFPVTLAAQLGATYDPPLGAVLDFPATLGAQADAGYAETIAGPSFGATLGATADAEAMPALAPSWLARVVMSGLSWLAGPFGPFILNPETALAAGASFGFGSDARVDYSTWDGFGVVIGETFDAAFGPAYLDGAAFPWTHASAFDADYSDAPPREADTDLYAQCIPVGLVARPVSSDIFADCHPAGLRASNGT